MVREIKRRGHPDFPDLKTARHPQYGAQGDGGTVAAGRGYVQRPCGRHRRDDEICPRGADARGRYAPLLIAVTQLTSTSEERMQRELLIASSIGDTIRRNTPNTRKAAGLDGVVCFRRSKRAWYTKPAEKSSSQSRPACVLQTVTWRIRCVSPRLPVRREIGSDFIVVGRPDHRRGRPCGCLSPLCGRILRIIREVTFKRV